MIKFNQKEILLNMIVTIFIYAIAILLFLYLIGNIIDLIIITNSDDQILTKSDENENNTSESDYKSIIKKYKRTLYTKIFVTSMLILAFIFCVKLEQNSSQWKTLYENQKNIELKLSLSSTDIKVGEPFSDKYNARHYMLTTDRAPIFPVTDTAILIADKEDYSESKVVNVTPENTTINGNITKNAKITKLEYRKNYTKLQINLYLTKFDIYQYETAGDVKLTIDGDTEKSSPQQDIQELFDISSENE